MDKIRICLNCGKVVINPETKDYNREGCCAACRRKRDLMWLSTISPQAEFEIMAQWDSAATIKENAQRFGFSYHRTLSLANRWGLAYKLLPDGYTIDWTKYDPALSNEVNAKRLLISVTALERGLNQQFPEKLKRQSKEGSVHGEVR